jgi:transcriptional antiterminator RfaH
VGVAGLSNGGHSASAPETTERAWAAVNTQPHREAVALENLERQDFVVYCPFVRRRVRHARKTQDVLRPMFPGYLFIAFDSALNHYQPIRSTVGVRSLVRSGDRLSLLSGAFIGDLKAREIDGVIGRPEGAYHIGQQIRLTGGPFDNLIGTIVEMDERERLTVLMNLLNGSVRVRVEGSRSAAL